ncbi:MAG: DUF4406 domain-containing protein [Aequoribacter sp.]|uniref:DUF7768 domain-containing protein n=1 Tax=Aequoribacter sp. TaxID=2847771 RepID=UPI003C32E1AB
MKAPIRENTPKLIYIAGPFRADTHWWVEQNCRIVEHYARLVFLAGGFPVAPHLIGRHLDGEVADDAALGGSIELMRRCDAILLAPGWENSKGSLAEKAEAERLGIRIFIAPPVHTGGLPVDFARMMRGQT